MNTSPAAGFHDFGTVLGPVALNAAAALRTAEFTGLQKQFSRIIVFVDYTRAATTSVSMTPTGSANGGATFNSYVSTAISAGAGTLSAYADTLTGTASFNIKIEYDVSGLDSFKLLFAGGGTPGAGDLLTVRGVAVVG